MNLLKMILKLPEVVYHMKSKKEIFNKILAEKASEFDNIKIEMIQTN